MTQTVDRNYIADEISQLTPTEDYHCVIAATNGYGLVKSDDIRFSTIGNELHILFYLYIKNTKAKHFEKVWFKENRNC